MESPMFNRSYLKQWLEKRIEVILAKGQSHEITDQEMVVLILKDQQENVDEFRTEVNQRFDQIDKRFDGLIAHLRWGTSLFMAMQMGIFLKLFLGS